MKKGIIMEQRRKFTILLTRDGTFEKGIVLQKSADIGEEVYFKPYKQSFVKNKYLPVQILSIASIIVLCFSFYFIPSKEIYAYITIDVNPSIELEIDEDYFVQRVRPINEDAVLVMNELKNIENKALTVVIKKIIEKSEEKALVNDERNVLVGISFDKDDDSDKKQVIEEIEREVGLVASGWNFTMFHVPKDIRLLADETNTSMNKVFANEFIKNEMIEEEIYSEYVLDDLEMEVISTFYEPKPSKDEENKVKVMSEPIDDDISDNLTEQEKTQEEIISIENKEEENQVSSEMDEDEDKVKDKVKDIDKDKKDKDKKDKEAVEPKNLQEDITFEQVDDNHTSGNNPKMNEENNILE